MSIFTKRHHVWLASALRDARAVPIDDDDAIERVIESLADSLAGESAAFDKRQFLKAIYGPFTTEGQTVQDRK